MEKVSFGASSGNAALIAAIIFSRTCATQRPSQVRPPQDQRRRRVAAGGGGRRRAAGGGQRTAGGGVRQGGVTEGVQRSRHTNTAERAESCVRWTMMHLSLGVVLLKGIALLLVAVPPDR